MMTIIVFQVQQAVILHITFSGIFRVCSHDVFGTRVKWQIVLLPFHVCNKNVRV